MSGIYSESQQIMLNVNALYRMLSLVLQIEGGVDLPEMENGGTSLNESIIYEALMQLIGFYDLIPNIYEKIKGECVNGLRNATNVPSFYENEELYLLNNDLRDMAEHSKRANLTPSIDIIDGSNDERVIMFKFCEIYMQREEGIPIAYPIQSDIPIAVAVPFDSF